MNRTYWFLFDGLPDTQYGDGISKYSNADEEALVKAHRDDPITEDMTFGELYDRKIMSTLCWREWTWGILFLSCALETIV